VKPAQFGYHRVRSVREAVEWLMAYEGSARVLAGGQSLAPMLNMRLLRPDALIDINDVAELAVIERTVTGLSIGAAVRYRDLEESSLVRDELPLVARVLRHIGDRQVRNRGTIGGSLAHGDPTGEMPLACLVLGAAVRVAGPDGSRTIPVADLYADSYTTVLEPLEVLTHVEFPASPPHVAFAERCRRHNDFAVISAASVGRRDDTGRWSDIRVGLGGVAGTPVLASAVGEALSGSTLQDGDILAACDAALAVADPASDIRASASYRRHLVPIYVQRVLTDLRERAAA
jgi:CO/xanthine dehydrogenase FAD-binding subunit